MGGSVEITCKPWDLLCALQDRFTIATPESRSFYPLLAGMPKSLLTVEEARQVDELAQALHGDLWQRGLNDREMSRFELAKFYALGNEILLVEGNYKFYQNIKLDARLQEEVDA